VWSNQPVRGSARRGLGGQAEKLRLDKLHVYYLDEGKMKEWIVEPDPPFKRMP
jgi:hypothetical protein